MALLAGASTALHAQADPWDGVRQLRPGQKIRVTDLEGHVRRGKVVSASQEALVLHQDGSDHTIARDQIAQVRVRKGSRLVRNILIAAGIGAAAGIALGAAYDEADSDSLAIMFGLIGAAGGAGAGTALSSYVVIYQRPEKQPLIPVRSTALAVPPEDSLTTGEIRVGAQPAAPTVQARQAFSRDRPLDLDLEQTGCATRMWMDVAAERRGQFCSRAHSLRRAEVSSAFPAAKRRWIVAQGGAAAEPWEWIQQGSSPEGATEPLRDSVAPHGAPTG
jgi:hypothetical protein